MSCVQHIPAQHHTPPPPPSWYLRVFFFNDTATTEIYTLSLHDALPIYGRPRRRATRLGAPRLGGAVSRAHARGPRQPGRSEEHTSELQSRLHLVCRLLLEKKKRQRLTPRPPPLAARSAAPRLPRRPGRT